MRRHEARIFEWTRAAVIALAAVWAGGTLLAPVLASRALGDPHAPAPSDSAPPDLTSMTVVASLYHAYAPACHQLSERAFHINGYPLAVCARCFGIYSGFLFGLIIYPFVRSLARTDMPRRLWLILALAPVSIDFLGGLTGAFENTHASRLITGALAGAAGAFYIMPGLICMTLSWGRSGPAAGAVRPRREALPEQ
ncbi:MAG TPA: DUF2085 domain-containing protein [Blastocatellia bacterium]|nr:DUF2085 domain-containing protein [Blastocatellia bacterium]